MEYYLPLLALLGLGLFAGIFDDDDDNDHDNGDNGDGDAGGNGGESYPFGATNGADDISGTPSGERIAGLSGDDTITGGDGDDNITGDPGDDLVNAGAGADTVNGSDGQDIIIGGSIASAIEELGGYDAFDDIDSDDLSALGVDDADALAAFIARDDVSDDGNDLLHGGKGDDVVADSAGHDSLYGDYGNDVVIGVDGADRAGFDALHGGMGDDTIIGDETDQMQGGEGNDVFVITAHDDRIGETVVKDFSEGDNVEVFLENAPDNADLRLFMQEDGAHLTLGSRPLALFEGVTTEAGLGKLAESITLLNSDADLSLTLNKATLSEKADSYTGNDAGETINALGGADTVYGAQGNDIIDAGAGVDIVAGEDGNDWLIGGAQGDVLNGGAGADTIAGGDGHDFISSSTSALSDYVDDLGLDDGDRSAFSSFVSGNKVSDMGDDEIRGEHGNDLITDAFGDNLLNGGNGDDTVNGIDAYVALDTGVDTIYGGYGDDMLFGDKGDQLTGGRDDDSFSVHAWDLSKAPVEIMDFEADESIEILIENPAQATLAFARSGTDVDISVNGAVVAKAYQIDSDALFANLQASVTLAKA